MSKNMRRQLIQLHSDDEDLSHASAESPVREKGRPSEVESKESSICDLELRTACLDILEG